MLFPLDHDVPAGLAPILRNEGHDVERVPAVLGAEAADQEILRFAATRGAVVFTCNRDDFLALARDIAHAGIIILIRRQNRHREYANMISVLRQAGEEGIRKNVNFA